MYSYIDLIDLTKILPLKGVIPDFMHLLLKYETRIIKNLIHEFNKIIKRDYN